MECYTFHHKSYHIPTPKSHPSQPHHRPNDGARQLAAAQQRQHHPYRRELGVGFGAEMLDLAKLDFGVWGSWICAQSWCCTPPTSRPDPTQAPSPSNPQSACLRKTNAAMLPSANRAGSWVRIHGLVSRDGFAEKIFISSYFIISVPKSRGYRM